MAKVCVGLLSWALSGDKEESLAKLNEGTKTVSWLAKLDFCAARCEASGIATVDQALARENACNVAQ